MKRVSEAEGCEGGEAGEIQIYTNVCKIHLDEGCQCSIGNFKYSEHLTPGVLYRLAPARGETRPGTDS